MFFKFDDLNLGLAESIEILKGTTQSFGKSEIAAFSNIENRLHYFTMVLIDYTSIGLLLPCKDCFEPQCHLPPYLFPHHPMSFFMLKFSMTLVSSFVCSNSFIAFPIFEFWIFFDFECLKRPQIVFYVSSEAKEGTHCQL